MNKHNCPPDLLKDAGINPKQESDQTENLWISYVSQKANPKHPMVLKSSKKGGKQKHPMGTPNTLLSANFGNKSTGHLDEQTQPSQPSPNLFLFDLYCWHLNLAGKKWGLGLNPSGGMFLLISPKPQTPQNPLFQGGKKNMFFFWESPQKNKKQQQKKHQPPAFGTSEDSTELSLESETEASNGRVGEGEAVNLLC